MHSDELVSIMPASYVDFFSAEEIKEHAELIELLSDSRPFVVSSSAASDKVGDVCIISPDFPGIFSVYAGLLGICSLNISAGSAFTSLKALPLGSPKKGARRSGAPFGIKKEKKSILSGKIVIDRFTVAAVDGSFESCVSAFEARIERLFATIAEASSADEGFAYAKEQVALEVARFLDYHREVLPPYMYPVIVVHDESFKEATRIRVASIDTPFFLYAVGTALNLLGVYINNVFIGTRGGQIEDVFDFLAVGGRVIEDKEEIERIRLVIMLTKHFTFFIASAPDPFRALRRFEELLLDFINRQSQDSQSLLENPQLLADLARLLGTSDFLWEDFVRLQFEQILPLLGRRGQELSTPESELEAAARAFVHGAESLEDKKKRLNDFKNRESFLIDMDHLLNWEQDFVQLSHRLSSLADVVVKIAMEIAWEECVSKYGLPKGAAGMDAEWCVCGLGKLGGQAIGYASDLELLCLYSDEGKTDGKEQIENYRFFEEFFKLGTDMIESKREGIFTVDLRLRPHGISGPVAVSLKSFVSYYGPAGSAHSVEKLALVRLRHICGSSQLGERIINIRDELIYETDSINLKEIRDLREKQAEHKTNHNRINVKFSPGGLVDIEYTVQLLQIIHGARIKELRTSSVHKALGIMRDKGIIKTEEAERMINHYFFLRRVINGLRMLRGNAKDLELPPKGSIEYEHLARRINYSSADTKKAGINLSYDIESRMAGIRTFVENYLGAEALPSSSSASIADYILGRKLEEEKIQQILNRAGLKNHTRAISNIKTIAKEKTAEHATLFLIAWDVLKNLPDADMALNNWERLFVSLPKEAAEQKEKSTTPTEAKKSMTRKEHIKKLAEQPGRIDILLKTLSASQYLADTLTRNPNLFEEATDPKTIHTDLTKEQLTEELSRQSPLNLTEEDFMNSLRSFKERHILRIAIRDICFDYPLYNIAKELSLLADSIIRHSLHYAGKKAGEENIDGTISILSFGKHGGKELNYSSDIDLLVLCTEDGLKKEEKLNTIIKNFTEIIIKHTTKGFLYRLDYRLRPFGSKGQLIYSLKKAKDYYDTSASCWEYQAALKLRHSAGKKETSDSLIEHIKNNARTKLTEEEIKDSIKRLRSTAIQTHKSIIKKGTDIKQDPGTIRDIEFAVQALQLINCKHSPDIWEGNTIKALEKLSKHNIISIKQAEQLRENYIFLRKTEHTLQLMENRQTHTLPVAEEKLSPIAKRINPNLDAKSLTEKLETIRTYNRDFYTKTINNTERQDCAT